VVEPFVMLSLTRPLVVAAEAATLVSALALAAPPVKDPHVAVLQAETQNLSSAQTFPAVLHEAQKASLSLAALEELAVLLAQTE